MDNYELFDETLESWVMSTCDGWRNNFESNYKERFEEYYRIFRGEWSPMDKTRESERSRIVSPATQQAVESTVAEIEEATFGRGRWFDIKDDIGDPRPDVVLLRERLYEDFSKHQIRKELSECILNSAIFGTGIGEITLTDEKEMSPATEPVMEGQLNQVGVRVRDRNVVRLRSVLPQNFLIDPCASSIDDALGVAIDEFVPKHQLEILQEEGVYLEGDITNASYNTDILADPTETSMYEENKARKTTYYGLVPRHLLDELKDEKTEGDK